MAWSAPSGGHYPLHDAADKGDDKAFLRLLESGADINVLDDTGRTVMCAAIVREEYVFTCTADTISWNLMHCSWKDIGNSNVLFMTEGRLAILKAILTHPDISLFTLNAPQKALNGVTSLGMAAWLNLPKVVYMLLEDGAGAVSVDGMDSHGATPLMCK
jgi:hypothetical protein